MKISSKIAYNTIIQIAGKGISTALGLISLAMMARYLNQGGFGEYTTITNFLSFFAIIADLGLTLVSVQMISRPGVDEKKILNNLFGLRLVSIILFLGLAPIFAFFSPYSPIIKMGILITSLSFIFPALNQIIIGLLQKKLRMDKAVVAENISRLILVAGIYLSIAFDYGLLGILWASVISSAANFIISYFLASKFIYLKPSFDKAIWLETITKSWPLAITIILNLLYLKTDTLILSLVRSVEEVGLYGAAYRIIDVLSTLPFMFAGIILPIMSAAWLEQRKGDFDKALQKSFDLMALFSLPIIAGAMVLAKPIMILVAGEDFAPSGLILKILIFAVAAIFLGCMFAHAVIAIDKQKKMIGSYLFVSISSVLLYLLIIPHFSYIGAASITVYSEIAISFLSAYVVWKYTRFIPSFKIVVRALFASILMGGIIYILPVNYYDWTNLVAGTALAGIIYLLVLYVIKGITKDDLKILLNRND